MNKEKLYCVSGFKPSSYSYDTLSRGFIVHCRAIKFYSFGIKELSGKKFTITVKFRKKSTCKHVVRTRSFRFPDEEPNKETPFNLHVFMEYRHRVRGENQVIITLSKKVKAAGKRSLGKSTISLEMFLQSPHLDRIELYTKKHEKVADIYLLFIGTINMTKEMLMEWAKKSGSKLGGFDVVSEDGGSAIRGVDTTDEEHEGEEDDQETDDHEGVHVRSQSGGGMVRRKDSSVKIVSPVTPINEKEGIGDSEDEKEGDNEDSESIGELEKKKKTLGSIMSKAARGLMKRKKGKRRGSATKDEEMDELRSQLGMNYPVDEQFERILDQQRIESGDLSPKIPSSEEEDSDSSSNEEDVKTEEKDGESSGEVEDKKKEEKKKENKSGDDDEVEGEEEDIQDSGDEGKSEDSEKEGEKEESDVSTEETEGEKKTKKKKRKSKKKKKKKKKKKRKVSTPTKMPDHLIFVDSSVPRGAELASYLTRRNGRFRDNTLYVSKYDDFDSDPHSNNNPLREVAARLYEVFKFGEVEVAKRIKFAVVGSDRFYSYILRELLSSSQFSEEFFEKLVFYLIPLVRPGEEKRKITINEYMASVSPYYERFFTGGDWKNAVRNLGFGGGIYKDHGLSYDQPNKEYQKEQKKMALMTVEKGIQHYLKNADELLRIPLSQVIVTFSGSEKRVNEAKSKKDPLSSKSNHLFVPLLSQLVIARRNTFEEKQLDQKKKGKKISTKKQMKEEQKKVKKSMLNVKLDYFQMNNETKLSLEKKRSQFHKLELSHLREGKHPNYLRKKGFALNIISKPVKAKKAGEKEKITKIDDIRKLICSVKEKKSVCEVDGFLFDRNVKHIQVDLKHPSEQTLCVALFSNKQKHYRLGDI